MKKKTHSLLKKQLRDHLGPAGKVPAKWRGFLAAVNEAYQRSDADRAMAENSLAAASQELFRRNQHLIQEIRRLTRAEQALKENESRFRVLADSAPVMIWMAGPHGGCTYFNSPWLEFTGRDLERELGEGWQDGIHSEDLEGFRAAYKESFRESRRFSVEFRLRRADGEFRWMWGTGAPRLTPDGRFAGYVGTLVDITERRRSEADLQEAQRRLRRQNNALIELAGRKNLQQGEDLHAALKEILEAASETLEVERSSVWFFERDSSHIRSVDLFERSSRRHSSGAVLAASDFPAYFQALREERIIAAPDAPEDPRTREFSVSYLAPNGIVSMLDAPIRLDGQLVGVLCHESVGTPRTWTPDEQQFAASVADMVALVMEAHERRWAEDALLKSEDRFQLVAKATNDAVWDWNMLTDEMWCNESVRTLFGYAADDVGATAAWWRDLIHPDDRTRVLAELAAAAEGEGNFWTGEYRLKKANGTYAAVLDRGHLIRDRAGKAVRMIRATADLTERKAMEARLFQSEKLSAMGQLAAGVAHEVNNPLGVILGFAQSLLSRMEPGHPSEAGLKSIEREAIRCKNLVQDLLTFSRASDAQQEGLELNGTVEGALSLVLAQSKMTKVELRRDLADNLPPILGNRNQLQQIVVNLANNALYAMPGGGMLTVKTELLVDVGGSWVCLKMSDTGTGIPPDIQSRIFDPFFTTKPVGSGTGLGLSLVYEIVKKHQGAIEVQSRPGLTEFSIKFPVQSGKMFFGKIPLFGAGIRI